MAYRYGNRKQAFLLPESIEEYISEDDPVRVYDAFIDAIDISEFGIHLDSNKVGNSTYDPIAMLKLLTYGYSYGIRSSRKLERALHHNMSFIWLTGGLKPDHKTISEFRRNNKGALKKTVKVCAKLCIKLNLIEGNVLFVDGTKIRANASRSSFHDKTWYQEYLLKLDKRIDELLASCEAADENEKDLGSYVKIHGELTEANRLKEKIANLIDTITDDSKKKISHVDPDSAVMYSSKGSHASYNVQHVVDEKNGLILNTDVVTATSDLNQFADQLNQAMELTGKSCETGCADAGYADTEELFKIDKQGIRVIVPSQRQAFHEPKGSFSKQHFIFDEANNQYICPAGHALRFSGRDKKGKKYFYRMRPKTICLKCKHFGVCTKSNLGRTIARLYLEKEKKKYEKEYEKPSSQEIYKQRKNKVEHPFGHIKRNLKMDGFLLRGLEGAKAEMSLLYTSFNLSRLMTILSVPKLVEILVDQQ